ncbi:MAG: hypothetical protein ISS48_02225 [Candidatus Aenigmarchaeota archaeon]|nr:hypothetical protein [Candidatus Aenigmarchaeota archaeon]
MNAIKLLNELRKYPVFGAEEVSRILNSNKRYANLVLTRLHNKKAIKKIEFGKYTLCNLAQTVATHLVKPSYITGWYALKVYGLTEQLPQQIDVLTTRKKNKKAVVFGQERIMHLTVDKKYLFEFSSEVSEEYTMNIASLEKTIVDCLYFDLAPFSVVIQAIKNGNISLERIRKICLKIKNRRFLKKVGIIFDSLGYDLYEYFGKHLDYNPFFIDKKLCGLLDKTKFKKWGVKCQ